MTGIEWHSMVPSQASENWAISEAEVPEIRQIDDRREVFVWRCLILHDLDGRFIASIRSPVGSEIRSDSFRDCDEAQDWTRRWLEGYGVLPLNY